MQSRRHKAFRQQHLRLTKSRLRHRAAKVQARSTDNDVRTRAPAYPEGLGGLPARTRLC